MVDRTDGDLKSASHFGWLQFQSNGEGLRERGWLTEREGGRESLVAVRVRPFLIPSFCGREPSGPEWSRRRSRSLARLLGVLSSNGFLRHDFRTP